MAPVSFAAPYTIANFRLKNKDPAADPRIIMVPDSPGIRKCKLSPQSLRTELQ